MPVEAATVESAPMGGWEILFLALWAGLLLGFVLGRRRGLAQGFQQGMRYAPLQIRHDSWLLGRCLVCNATPLVGNADPEEGNAECHPADPGPRGWGPDDGPGHDGPGDFGSARRHSGD